ncbi:hypothetical protein GA0004734_00048130 [Rhizobium sp. 9140]|nr:hypothetical protein GA0004734_00048130 [Rhizobium sp. 9140]
MELYLKVRLACSEGMSRRQAAKHFNISRDSVSKMLSYSTPPGYQRQSPIRRPKLDAFVSTIDHWLDEDRQVPRKQRHTAKRVFDRLRDECGFTGGYTIIKDYMRERDQRRQEVFVPLSHPPGHAQADFGEAMVVIGGVEQKAHFFVLDLPHSDGCYVRAYPAAVAEAWVDGHVHAFAFFGAVPQSIVYDNDRCVNGGVKSCHAAAQKSATCGARMRPPGGLRPERGSHARVAIFEGRQPAFRARLWARR